MNGADMQQMVAVPGGYDELDGKYTKAEGLGALQQRRCHCS